MIASILILALFFSCILAMLYDIECAIEEALLDELWDEDE